jgi:hypothetical protein
MNSRFAWSWAWLLLFAQGLMSNFSAMAEEPGDVPGLSLVRSNGSLVISWPTTSALNWVLEQTDHLTGSDFWSRISPALYSTDGATSVVLQPLPEQTRFYRLRRVEPAIPELTAAWSFDEGAGQTSEDSAHLTDAVIVYSANADWSSGRVGASALWFNGQAEGAGTRAWFTNTAYRVIPPPGEPFSISFWLRPDELAAGWRTLMGHAATGGGGWQALLHSAGPGTNYFVVRSESGGTPTSISGRTLLLPGQWRQFTFTHDGTLGSIYLDTSLLAREPLPMAYDDGPVFIGSGVAGSNSFLGSIDELRTFTRCLSDEDLSLAARWDFDEVGGSHALDGSINGRHASLAREDRVPGRSGLALDLTTNQMIIANRDQLILPPNGNAFSLSFWVKRNTSSPGTARLMSCAHRTNAGWHLDVDTSAMGVTSIALTSTNTGGTLELVGAVPLAEGAWSRIDITHNGGSATLYCNGRKIQTAPGAIRASRAPLIVGGMNNHFDGAIDDVRIYARELDAAEIGPVAATMWETALLGTTTNFVLNGAGPRGRSLTYAVQTTGTRGSVSIVPASGLVTYQAPLDKGPDTFTYTVSDGEWSSEPAVVTMSVVQPHWLAPNGGTVQPLDGSSPQQAWAAGNPDALDAIWKTNNFYDCFFYAPGEYQTRGWKYVVRGTAHPGCKHIGSGADAGGTTIKLVDTWAAHEEGVIFSVAHGWVTCDGFEVHNLVLDCNAENNPKYERGEPIWIRIPLNEPSLVDAITLRWREGNAGGFFHRFGRAAQFRVCTRQLVGGNYITNCMDHTSTGSVDVVTLNSFTDEILLYLDRRAANVDYYGLNEVEVSGAAVSLPSATQTNGTPSRLDAQHTPTSLVDGNPRTFWASGSETVVELVIPLAPGTWLNQINLDWHCQTVSNAVRFGAASDFTVRARNEQSGEYLDVPITRHPVTAEGREPVTFGGMGQTNVIVTDRLAILLKARAPAVNFYALKEIGIFQNWWAPVNPRVPTSLNNLGENIIRAFDADLGTGWASGMQGQLSAFELAGSNMKLTNLKIKGFGTKAGKECFPLHIFANYSRQHFGNVLVEDCVLAEPAASNSDGLTGITIGAWAPATMTNAVARRCIVTNLGPRFSYASAFSATHVENCFADNCSGGVYFEPDRTNADDLGYTLIRSNRFVNVGKGIYLLFHPAAQFDFLTCLDNEIVLRPFGAGIGIGACDTCAVGESGTIRGLIALNNIIRYEGWDNPASQYNWGLYASDVRHAIFGNNLVHMGPTLSLRVRHYPAGVIYPPPAVEDCEGNITLPPFDVMYTQDLDVLPAGYRRAWFNNYDLSGTRLDVRTSNNGIDTPALQQQWSE